MPEVSSTPPGAPAAAAAAPLPDFNKLWDYEKPAETERTFRALLPAAGASGDRSYELQLLTQVARCQGLQEKYAEAHATLDAVELRLADDGPTLARVRCLLERGRVFNSSGQPKRAVPLFEQAWQVAEAAGEERYAADALHMLAIAAPTPAERRDGNLRCLDYVRRRPKQEGWLPAVYNNLGESYRALGEYERALDCFRKILEFDRLKGRESWLYNRLDEARMLRMAGRADEAFARVQDIADELRGQNKADGFVEEELAECLIAVGRASEAGPHAGTAWELLRSETWLAQQEPDRYRRLRELAGGQG
jgi:tetratricopeptide (TPR) repeat protein